MKKQIITFVCLLLGVAAGALAQHWTVNPHAFQYDMTAYVSMKGMSTAGQLADFELAAFYGEECCGVGKILTADDGTSIFQLRIRSNVTTGEVITFCFYQRSEERELYPYCQLDFEAQTVVGTPSEPMVMEVTGLTSKGDVNGDGSINAQDASLIQQFVARKFGDDAEGFSVKVADVNGDGEVTAQDASLVQQYAARKITW